MKILQINTTVNSGSTGRIAEDIGKTLLLNNHKSYVAYGRGNQQSTSNLIKVGNVFDTYFHGLKSLLTDRHGFGSKRATIKLIKKIELISPNVIGLHNIHGYYLNIEIFFKYINKKNIPLIWTFHDCWPMSGHCAFLQCNKCKDCQNKYPKSIFLNQSSRNYNDKKKIFSEIKNLTIVTPSMWLKKIVEKSFFNQSVTCINNGIDLERFKISNNYKKLSGKLNLTKTKIILGVASIWDERKGFDDFIKLSALINSKFKIILIGLSKKQMKKLPSNIIGVQRTENISELVSYYNLADVFINPTSADNFPTTNLESLACGTPVVTYNTGGSPESIDSNTGIVVEEGDLKGLLLAVDKIISSKTNFSKEQCRSRAEKFYDKKDRFNDYLELYKQAYKIK